MKDMKVKDRATSPAECIPPDMLFRDALALMREKGCRRLPVIDGGKLVGIVTDRDLLRAVMRYIDAPVEVRDLMTTSVVTTGMEDSLREAARTMMERRLGGLPVVDADGQVQGIVTETDIFRTFVKMLE
jgi:acetoin utilization protein AcuB